jgi:hypothetical protein
MRKSKKLSPIISRTTLLILLLMSLPATAQFAFECTRANGTTFISQSKCPDGVSWRRIQTDPYYTGPVPSEGATPNAPSSAPSQSLAQLQAACPQEFDYLAANSERFQWDYAFRLSALKAKCAATTTDCYWAFDRLHRHGFGKGGGSVGDRIAAKRQAETYRAKCGMAEEPKTSMTCTQIGNSNSMKCR